MDTIVQIVVLSYVKTSSIMVQQANGEQKEVCQYKDFTGSDLDSKTNKNSVCADCNSNIWSPKVKQNMRVLRIGPNMKIN